MVENVIQASSWHADLFMNMYIQVTLTNYSVKSVVRSMSIRRAAAGETKNGRLEKRLYPCVRWGVQNLAHFLELFQYTLCHPSHSLLPWLTDPNACATPTNSTAHVSPVSSKVTEMCMRHTLRKCTLIFILGTYTPNLNLSLIMLSPTQETL